MMRKIFIYSIVAVFLLLNCFSSQSSTYAQVVLDGSMGSAGQLNGPDYAIKAGYGQQAGANLFHSFQQFNINTNESATFSGPNSVQNIISRVTGGNSSWIDGRIASTISGANLYFLNPAGVMFGANASLDIGGSFHVSTADYLRLGKNERFYAAPAAGEVLSTASPTAFGFLSDEPAGITFEGKEIEESEWDENNPTGLVVPQGETISVIGGDIQLAGKYYRKDLGEGKFEDVATGSIAAPEGRINIASVASQGEVIPTADDLETTSPKTGDINLEHSLISVSGEGAGSIFIRGGQFLADNSKLAADTKDKDGGVTDIRADTISIARTDIFNNADGTGSGGDIKLTAKESVTISELSRVFGDAWDAGDAGDISIETKNLSVSTAGVVSSDTHGTGRGGNITLRGSESVRISDPESKVFANAMGEDADAGDGGTILIETPNFSLLNKGNISSDTYEGGGDGGRISISGTDRGLADSVEVSDSQILSGTRWGINADAGVGGTVEIKAKNVSFTDGGRIGSESDGSGKGGNVSIYASESLLFSGANEEGKNSKVYTSALSKDDYAGDAGDISIRGGHIMFKAGGGVTASTGGPGNAGVIEINADKIELDTKASISSASEIQGKGGDAGSVSLFAADLIRLTDESSITTSTWGQGAAGDISVKAPRLELESKSFVSSESLSEDQGGPAGSITFEGYSINISGGSAITTEALGAGGGKIFLNSDKTIYLLGGKITSSVKIGEGEGGDVTIGTPGEAGSKSQFIIMNGSYIQANADLGDGGAIFIHTDNYMISTGSATTATSRRGNDGTVTIEAPNTDMSGDLTVLSNNYIDATRWMQTPCAARTAESLSRFVLTGRDAAAFCFDDWQPSLPLWSEKREVKNEKSEQ